MLENLKTGLLKAKVSSKIIKKTLTTRDLSTKVVLMVQAL